jgi:hypothetical protein
MHHKVPAREICVRIELRPNAPIVRSKALDLSFVAPVIEDAGNV